MRISRFLVKENPKPNLGVRFRICLAEKEGFEPSLRVYLRTTPLAGEPLRPLGYFSMTFRYRSVFHFFPYSLFILPYALLFVNYFCLKYKFCVFIFLQSALLLPPVLFWAYFFGFSPYAWRFLFCLRILYRHI